MEGPGHFIIVLYNQPARLSPSFSSPYLYYQINHHVSQERYVESNLILVNHPRPRFRSLSPVARSSRTALTTSTADSFPSSAAFDVIQSTLQSDDAERKSAINSAKAIVAFNLKNAKGEEQSWYLDLKNKGEVGKGAAPAGGKADGESTSK